MNQGTEPWQKAKPILAGGNALLAKPAGMFLTAERLGQGRGLQRFAA